jgi:hypothetical protein
MTEEDQKDLQRFRWLVENVTEEAFDVRRANNDFFDDVRLKYRLPTLISYTCVGSPVSFREAIDIKMGTYLEDVE